MCSDDPQMNGIQSGINGTYFFSLKRVKDHVIMADELLRGIMLRFDNLIGTNSAVTSCIVKRKDR